MRTNVVPLADGWLVVVRHRTREIVEMVGNVVVVGVAVEKPYELKDGIALVRPRALLVKIRLGGHLEQYGGCVRKGAQQGRRGAKQKHLAEGVQLFDGVDHALVAASLLCGFQLYQISLGNDGIGPLSSRGSPEPK